MPVSPTQPQILNINVVTENKVEKNLRADTGTFCSLSEFLTVSEELQNEKILADDKDQGESV